MNRKPGQHKFRSAPAGAGTTVHAEPHAEHDYTPQIIDFLREIHGKIRCNPAGDYYYGDVSTISLHFLLGSRLPSKDVLWAWYQYFDRERAESIYQTLRPLQDETFLDILAGCSFHWDEGTVRDCGLLFLESHRSEVYRHIEQFMNARLDAYRSLSDDQLRSVLTARNTRTESHVGRLVRKIQTRPFSAGQRQSVYARFEADYLRATARHLMDEAVSESFWRRPPPELESLKARFALFRKTLLEEARRLGVYVSRETYEGAAWGRARDGNGRRAGARGRPFGNGSARAGRRRDVEAVHFAILGLQPSATLPEVKTAYREKVKQFHPDQGGTVQEFLQVQEAYEYLISEVY